ncbi:MAG: signal recognition particle-docking protein FtsY [Candidatus Aenigmarchaeota archaeon]|nr:signal recognition particle-docking protein FtsY [Candidatus Aenigmarchaeota archaeon]
MFGGLKKKLQEAIAKVTAPKKEEIREELKKAEAEQLHEEVREEIKELELKEKETEEQIESRMPETLAEHIEESIESKLEKEELLIEKLEKKLEQDEQGDIEQLAKEEFEKIVSKEQLGQAVDKEDISAAHTPSPYPLPEKKSFIAKIVQKIAEKTLDEANINDIVKNLELVLLENDTALEVAEKICADVKNSLVGKSVKRGDVEKVVKDALRTAMLDVMTQEKIDLEKMAADRKEPLLVMFLGFNGTGKTTTLAKFGQKFKKYNPVLAAGDTFRAASIEQLEEHGKKLDIEVVKHKYGADSAAVIFDARKHAQAIGSQLVLADTAGRSHSNVNLMDELKKVVRVNSPDLKLLVLDSVTGNDIYDQARLFNEAVGVDGIILTKADVYDKGGAALSAAYTIKKPILFLGIGQEYQDLKEFVPEEVVENLLE